MRTARTGNVETQASGWRAFANRNGVVSPGASEKRGRTLSCLVLALSLLVLVHTTAAAQNVKRLVILKVDGLPQDTLERYVRERDPRTGKSRLPWMEHLFYERGTRLANFYVRGMSLSGPSWSMLDTGQHLQIKGNVEFDRYTLHSYDYLNFIPFWIGNVAKQRVDMPGVELMDELGLPLLVDAYPYDQRHISFQLYQRGLRWTTLERGLKNRFTTRGPRELLDEWTIGIDSRAILMEQLEREVLEKLNDPRIRYLDLYTTDFDHAAHHNRDPLTQFTALRELDALVGRLWSGIEKSPLASETALVLVSDHGTNSDSRVYSQGFNLVTLLGSVEGGGHHVITKRRLMNDYALQGIYPLIPLITTTTQNSYYLKGQDADYPTALVDFDGNERASIHLRDADLNVLHILLQQLRRKDLAPEVRRAATSAFFTTIDRRRAEWQDMLAGLDEELHALSRLTGERRALFLSQPKKWTKADRDAGRDQDAVRLFAQADSWTNDQLKYREYMRVLGNLLALRRETFDPLSIRVEDLISKGAMGDSNTIHKLQNYVVGLAPGGLALAPDGSLDMERSFTRVNYFTLLGGSTVRNNVQPGVENRPVDFVAVRVPHAKLWDQLTGDLRADDVLWLYGAPDRQALILARNESGRLLLRYLPVANLEQRADGRVRFERTGWRAQLPLKIWEDTNFAVPAVRERAAWLDDWHTDLEWLRAAHRTQYSNAVVGLHEQLASHTVATLDTDAPGLSKDERLVRRLRQRQRALVETDLLILANNHWNFDVRGFNPGGNHGSFFRVSTHSAFMLAGGEQTGIPRGLVVEEPYDSLSFMPTLMTLAGQLQDPRTPVRALWQQGTGAFPGRIVEELFTARRKPGPPVVGASALEGGRQ